MNLYRQLRLAPLLAAGSGLFAAHCGDRLADDCKRTLSCAVEDLFMLGPDCTWRYADGTVWLGGPARDASGVWRWDSGTGAPAGRDFKCGDDFISADDSLNVDGARNRNDSAPPPSPDCRFDFECSPPTECDRGTGTCVGCVADESCAESAPRCDKLTLACQPCTDSAQCERFEYAARCSTGGRCVQCLEDGQCAELEGTTQCKEETGSCVQCTANVHCEDDRDNSLCDLTTNTCVPCVEGTTDCPGEFPICAIQDANAGTARCVACTGNSGPNTCQDPNAANCNQNGDCVPCTANDQCTHLGANRGLCDTNLNPNRCVQCIVDDDCDSPTASRCVNNQCVECDRTGPAPGVSVGCGGDQPGGSVCDTSANPNQCVQCLGTDFAACAVAGSPRVCDSVAKTCTNFLPATAARCAACVSDAHCVSGSLCVAQALGTGSGNVCMPRALPEAPVCGGFGAFRISSNTDSLDEDDVDVCITFNTCPAIADFALPKSCTADGDCGAPGVNDGICATTASGQSCTIACGNGLDCGDPEFTVCDVLTTQRCVDAP